MLTSLDRRDHSASTLTASNSNSNSNSNSQILKLAHPSSPATQLLSPSTLHLHSSPHYPIHALPPSKLLASTTPTTSTIHASKQQSSSKRNPPIRIPIEPGHCLVFGRKPDLSLLSSEITPKSKMLPITLPKSFTHASRTHCLCTLIAPPLGGLNIRIVVKGQNGLMVDGERFEEGSSAGVELERRDGEQIELGFYGGKKVECYVKIDDHLTQRVRARPNAHAQQISPNTTTATPQPEAARSTKHATGKTRGRKRKVLPTGLTNSNRDSVATDKLNHDTSSKPHPSSPTIANITPETPVSSFKLTADTFKQQQQPLEQGTTSPPTKKLCLSPIPSPPYDPQIHNLPPGDRVRSVIQSMGLDLLGLIASAVVFSSRATVSTTEVIRAVLETQPSLAEAVLSLLPTPTSSRSSPRPPPRADEDFEIGPKKERECLSAPLPSLYLAPDDPTTDTKPFATDLKPSPSPHHHHPHPHHYGSEGGAVGSPVLDFQPSDVKTDRVVNACRPVMLETLRTHWRRDGHGMFGCVTNEGLKDASGEPLEALWYYQPQHDSDHERRLNLQPYVRHVRHTQTTSKQYFFKKVRGSGRRKS
ncbi:hypothetical protein PCASD_00835 [Puccinia coronata f. sp. avenae]|uniref:FHA domain-containing protein n=1 Tax=Puccinia coronata f. sp. avenae TaxID=200324 RepID=A0A2N5VPM1_9BASI|nr:hypothetical protein PCASD_12754 [Puccinia coronata f. sp. avenae]PLW51916.1 hypothetical protein PCASD_00835 [Puccinia coronata f. sp. avenae]